MPNEIQSKFGTPIVWADATDYTDGHGMTQTAGANIDLTSLAAGAARQGVKVDLGANAAGLYIVRAGIEFDVAPTAGDLVEVGFSWSQSATAGTGNDAGASGADAAYKASEETEWFAQLLDWYHMIATADAATTVQIATLGTLRPRSRYVSPIVLNSADQAFEGDAVEMFIALIPVTQEVQ